MLLAASKTTGGVLLVYALLSEIVESEKGAEMILLLQEKSYKNIIKAGEAMVDTFGSAEEKLAGGLAEI